MASHSPQRSRRLQTQQLNQGMSSFIHLALSHLHERYVVHGLNLGRFDPLDELLFSSLSDVG